MPEGFHTDLPDPIHVKTDFATVDKTYRFDGKEIVAERTVVVLKQKLPKSDWKRYRQFTKDIGLEGETWIQLIKPYKPVPSTVAGTFNPNPVITIKPPKKPEAEAKPGQETLNLDMLPANAAVSRPTPLNPSDFAAIKDMMKQAAEQLHAGDVSGATSTLDMAKARNANEQFLWADYGIIAEMQHNNEEAKADFEKELANFPDSDSAAFFLAELQDRTGDAAAARHTLQGFLDKHPDNLQLAERLAALQTAAEDNIGALKTLQSAADQHPDDRPLRLQLGHALLKMDRKDEAAAAIKSAMDGSDDPGMLNDAAYELSEIGLSMPFAEQVSRQGIAKLEEQSAAISTAEANSKAFAQSSLLLASWDTLGWILFREQRFPEAKPYLVAAWRNSLHPEVGDHLAQLYEALGDSDDASVTYSLALASIEGGKMPADVRRHIESSMERLKKAGAKPGPNDSVQALQDSRNYKLPKAAGLSGWGTFRLQLGAAGVLQAQQMTGEKKLEAILDAIRALPFPDLVPPESKAHLLRSAVVSCSASTGCELVLVPNSSLQTEQY